MPWSNDQLNELYIYDPVTGELILRITNAGFYYVVGEAIYQIDSDGLKASLVADNGSYLSLVPRDGYDGTRVVMQPPDHDGTPWERPSFMAGTHEEITPGDWRPWTFMASASDTDEFGSAQVAAYGKSTGGEPSFIYLAADQILSENNQQMSLGCLDTYVGTSFFNFNNATFVAEDWLSTTWFGSGMDAGRIYEIAFAGTVQSSAANDRIGLRIYHNTAANLTGATLIQDCGQVRVDVANIAQPFRVDVQFDGIATADYILLGVNRSAGAGNCNVTTFYRRLADLAPA